MQRSGGKGSVLAFYGRIGLVLHAFLLSLFILYIGKVLFIPLFFALLIAILLYPLTLFFEQRIKKTPAAILSVLIFIFFVGLLIFFFIKELLVFFKDLPLLQSKFLQEVQSVQNWIVLKFHINVSQQMEYIRRTANDVLSDLLSSAGATVIGFVEVIVLFAFFLIFTYFILLHRRLFKSFILSFFNESQQLRVNTITNSTRTMINHYVLGLLTEMAVLFTLILVVLLILGAKYALLIAVIAAVFNIIPYIGIYVAAAIAMFISLINGSGHLAIEVGITFVIVHFIDANILMPHIVGSRVKINPFITIVAVITGKLIWGIPGMFLFIPLTAIIRIISENVSSLKPWSILIGEEKG
ncbi:MAG: AI-2E family transporter [Bacteroidota bacterium]|nr:AI-2E family transporter [Flavisolibacter sp.]MBD0374586.1 AI-2E family transporter [Flavisolibacter sp.]MDQ3843061.1 AI-2E family transporter [Bacteroidota bacterium]